MRGHLVHMVVVGAVLVGTAAHTVRAQHAPNPLPLGIEPTRRADPVDDPAGPTGAVDTADTTKPAPVRERIRSRFLYSPGSYAEQCLPRDAVVELVARHLGDTPFSEPATQLVLLSVEGDGTAPAEVPTEARIDLLDISGRDLKVIGSRVVKARDGCMELLSTAALQLAIALEPDKTLDPLDVPAPTTPPLDVRPPAKPTTPEEPPNPMAPVTLLSASMHVAGFLAPEGVMLGGAVGAGARWSFLSARVEGRLDLSGDDRGTTSFPVLLSVVPCAHLPLAGLDEDGDLELTGCLTATAGVMPASGVYSGVGFYVGSGGRISLDWRVDDEFTVRFLGQLEGAFVRPTFESSSGAATYESPAFNLLAGIGMDLPNFF